MPESWLPQDGGFTGMDDGAITVARDGDGQAHRVEVADGVVSVTRLDDVPPETVVLPADSEGRVQYADGRPVPPFDEAALLEAGPWVRGGDLIGVLALDGSPFGNDKVLRYEFVDAQLKSMSLVDLDVGEPGSFVELAGDVLFTWRTHWSNWCEWRAGSISGEEMLGSSQLRGTWGYITLAQGLFEADHFRAGRSQLEASDSALMYLRLLNW